MIDRKVLAVIFIVFAFGIAFHQFYYWGVWFEVEDIHHETFMIILVFAAFIVYYVKVGKEATAKGCFS